MPNPATVSILLWCLLWCYLPFTILFYQNRESYPIKGRMPRLMVLLNLLLMGLATQCVFAEQRTFYPCILVEWITLFFITFPVYLYFVRVLWLVFSHELTINISKLTNGMSVQGLEKNWYVRHRSIFESRKLIFIFCCLFFIDLIILLCNTATSPELWNVHYLCPSTAHGTYQIVWIISMALVHLPAFLGFIFSGYKITSFPDDAYHIKKEFKAVISGIIVIFIIGVIILIALKADGHGAFWISLLILIHHVILSSIVWPYYLCQQEKKFIQNFPLETLLLSEVLTYPPGFQAFYTYLQSEFSNENLLFYINVNHFKNLDPSNGTLIKEEAIQIYQKFIKNGAPCQVNLSYSFVSGIEDELRTLSLMEQVPKERLELFKLVQQEIYNLMSADPYYRFQRKPEFQILRTGLVEQKLNRSVVVGRETQNSQHFSFETSLVTSQKSVSRTDTENTRMQISERSSFRPLIELVHESPRPSDMTADKETIPLTSSPSLPSSPSFLPSSPSSPSPAHSP